MIVCGCGVPGMEFMGCDGNEVLLFCYNCGACLRFSSGETEEEIAEFAEYVKMVCSCAECCTLGEIF